MAKKSLDPIVVGGCVFIRTVTMYYVGRVAEIQPDRIILTDAAWIADTGRFSEALKTGRLNEVEPFPDPVCIFNGSIIDATVWKHPVPLDLK